MMDSDNDMEGADDDFLRAAIEESLREAQPDNDTAGWAKIVSTDKLVFER